MDEGPVPGLWAPQRRALTAGLVLTITLVASEALAVVTVMPVVVRDLGGLRLYGWVFSGFMLGSWSASWWPAARPIAGVPRAVRDRAAALRLGPSRGGPGSLDGGARRRPGAPGFRRRCGSRGGLCDHRPEPARELLARTMAVLSTAWVVPVWPAR